MAQVEGREEAAVRRIARGAVQTLTSAYAGRVVTWIAIVVLTRELPPEAFGQVALAASGLALVSALRSFGLHNALLHHYKRVDELAPTHFFLNTALAVLGTVGAIALAVLFVDGRWGRGVATALAVFAAFDLLRATALTAETQLRRDLEFGSLASAHALALILAAISGIALAFLGGGIWALILSHSVYGIATSPSTGPCSGASAPPWPSASPTSDRTRPDACSGTAPDLARHDAADPGAKLRPARGGGPARLRDPGVLRARPRLRPTAHRDDHPRPHRCHAGRLRALPGGPGTARRGFFAGPCG